MSRRLIASGSLSVLLLTASVFGGQSAKKPVTNTDVVNMTKAGLSDEVTIAAIQDAAVDFDTSADALVALKRDGVTDRVIRAMLQAKPQAGAATNTVAIGSNGHAATTTTKEVVVGRTAVRTIDHGALDRIELFIEKVDQPAAVTVVMRPFDASAADLGLAARMARRRGSRRRARCSTRGLGCSRRSSSRHLESSGRSRRSGC